MTVGELIAQLQQLPQDCLVGIAPGAGEPIFAAAGAELSSIQIGGPSDGEDEYEDDVTLYDVTFEVVVIRGKHAAANDL